MKQAIDSYRNDNDWLLRFLTEYCEQVSVDEPAIKPSELFNAYISYCKAEGEEVRSATEFYSRLKTFSWITRKETHHQVKLRGIRIKTQQQTDSSVNH